MQVAPAIQKAWRGEAALYHGSWGSNSINDVSAIFPVMYGKDANDNYSRDPELEKLVAEGGASSDPAARKKAYSAAIKLMTDKAYWMPLFTYVNAYAFSKSLDLRPTPTSCRASTLRSGNSARSKALTNTRPRPQAAA